MTQVQQKRYSSEELREFEGIILQKLEAAQKLLNSIMEDLSKKRENSADTNVKMLEDGSEAADKENLSQQAARQRKFIAESEAALMRIKNGTYGVCIVTGELIDRERLRAVPHTRHSLAAKLAMQR